MTLIARAFMPQRFTGWHMLAIMIAFFGVIVGVNITLAVFASASWSGLLVKNTYVESQNFTRNTERRRQVQASLGWQADATVDAGVFSVRLTDEAGQPVYGATVSAAVGRPTHAGDDHTMQLVSVGEGTYQAPAGLAPGIWRADVTAVDSRRQPWTTAFRFTVPQPRPPAP